MVSAAYFDVLGVRPWRGRFFSPADDAAACPASRVVLGYDFWQRELGGRDQPPTRRC